MIAAVVVVVVAVAGVAGAEPEWCAPARQQLAIARTADGEPDTAVVTALLATLPPLVAGRARDDIGREARLSAAVDAAALAVRVGCVDVAVGEGVDDVVARLGKDPRLAGLRTEDNFSEKVKDRLWKMFSAFAETDGAQSFIQNSRVFYIGGLAVACAFIAWRLLRRRRRGVVDPLAGTRVERERQRAFAAWRKDAVTTLEQLRDGDVDGARRALVLLRAALLARVGEDPGVGAGDAVKPWRTSRETLERLPERARDVVTPALTAFDDGFYGGAVDVAGARAFLAVVDEAAAALSRGRP